MKLNGSNLKRGEYMNPYTFFKKLLCKASEGINNLEDKEYMLDIMEDFPDLNTEEITFLHNVDISGEYEKDFDTYLDFMSLCYIQSFNSPKEIGDELLFLLDYYKDDFGLKGEFGYEVVEDGLLFRYSIPIVEYNLKLGEDGEEYYVLELGKDGEEYYVNLGAEAIKLMCYYLDYKVEP